MMRRKAIGSIGAVACCLTLGASAATYYVDNKLDDYTPTKQRGGF